MSGFIAALCDLVGSDRMASHIGPAVIADQVEFAIDVAYLMWPGWKMGCLPGELARLSPNPLLVCTAH